MCDRRAVVTYSCATALRGGAYMQIMCRGRKWDLGYGLEETGSGFDMGSWGSVTPGRRDFPELQAGQGWKRQIPKFNRI